MKKRSFRCVSLIIALMLVLTSLPMVLMADEGNDGNDGSGTDDNYVVMLNDQTGYTSFTAALEDAGDGDTLRMLQDIFLAGPVAVNIPGGTITLDLGGCSIRLYDEAENAVGEGGDADTGSGGVFVLEAGTLNVVDEIMGAPQRGTLNSTNQSWPIFWLEGDNAAVCLEIEGGVFQASSQPCIGIDPDFGDGSVSISGGNFNSRQPDEYIASGYGQVQQEDGTFEVEQVQTFSITWQNWDGTVLESDNVNEGDTPQYSGDTPTKPEDDDNTYEFAGWDQEVVPAESDAVYTAVYNAIPKPTQPLVYTITWQNWDGTVLESDNVNEGDTPQYSGDTPTKPEDDDNTYEFAGWDQEVVPAESDAVYTAVFNAVPKPTPPPVPVYTVTWQNWDGTVLESDNVNEGDTPQYYGDTPTKPEDDGNTYEFAGWDQEVVPAESDAVYTAVYNAVPKPTQPPAQVYNITWKNWDGSVLSTTQVQAGAVPAYNGATPARPADNQYTYTFAGWQPQPAAATADAAYTAVFSTQPVQPAPTAGFVSGTVTLYSFSSGQVQEGYPVLYQEGTSDNPYVDLAGAFSMMSGWYQNAGKQVAFTTSYNNDPNHPVFTIARENGSQAVYDPGANTMTFSDFEGFTDYGQIRLNAPNAGLIQQVPDNRVYPHKVGKVTVTLSDYGFSGSVVNGTVILPAAAFSGLFLAPAGMNWICIGTDAFLVDGSAAMSQANDQGVSISDQMQADLNSGRSQAAANAAYQELCLAWDLYCGHKEDLGILNGSNAFFQAIGLNGALAGTDPDAYRNAISQLSEIYLGGTGNDGSAGGYTEDGNTARITITDFCSMGSSPSAQDISDQPDAYTGIDTPSLITYANQQITRADSPVNQVVIDLTSASGNDKEALQYLVSWVLGQAVLAEQNEETGSGHVTIWQADVDRDGQITDSDHLDLDNCKVSVQIGSGTREFGNAAAAMLKHSGRVTTLGRITSGGDSVPLTWTAATGDVISYPGTSRIRLFLSGSYQSIASGVEADGTAGAE